MTITPKNPAPFELECPTGETDHQLGISKWEYMDKTGLKPDKHPPP